MVTDRSFKGTIGFGINDVESRMPPHLHMGVDSEYIFIIVNNHVCEQNELINIPVHSQLDCQLISGK